MNLKFTVDDANCLHFDLACDTYTTLPTTLSWNILGGVPTTLGEFPWMVIFLNFFFNIL